jgi:hypothetical protein
MPFWDLVRDFAAQDLSRHGTARAMGFENPSVFHALLSEYHELDPFPTVLSIPAQYTRDSGESFRAACLRLAKTHTVKAAAIAIGYACTGGFRHAMKTRGIEVTFRKRTRAVKPAAKPPVSDAEALRYAALRLNGDVDNGALAKVGRSKSALSKRLRALSPDLWQKVMRVAVANHSARRTERSQTLYAHYLANQKDK